MSQVDADNRGQQLRRQANRQRQGKEKGLQDRTRQIDVDRKDRDYQHQRHLDQEIAELPYTVFKICFLRSQF